MTTDAAGTADRRARPPLSDREGTDAPRPLVAVAHGSADPRAAKTVQALLDVVRARADRIGLAGLDARAAYLGHAPPTVAQALDALNRPAVVLPLLLTAAYHSGTDIPELLRAVSRRPGSPHVSYGRTLGPHPLLLRVVRRRVTRALHAAGVADRCDASGTTVVLAAAGSSDRAANATVADLAAYWQARSAWRAVVPCYASAASPAPTEAVTAALRDGARHVVVASYLLAPGTFADEIRRAAGAAGAVAASDVLGAAPEVADVLLDRYRDALLAGEQYPAAAS